MTVPEKPVDTAWISEAGAGRAQAASELFIVRQDGEQAAEELAALAAWVHEVLVPIYIDHVGQRNRWCVWWWEHPGAVARLHALWLAWQELTAPAAGLQGPSRWHRDHLEPVLRALRGDEWGPFGQCHRHTDEYKRGEADRDEHLKFDRNAPVAPYDGPPSWLIR
jgi:hypothetical protein